MTITINGPDGSTFNFPDDTPPGEISGAMAKHYGPPQAAAPPPTTAGMIATELGRGVPIAGPAITNRIGSTGREAWEGAHPVLSTALQAAGGLGAFALAPEAEAATLGTSMIPRALGMTGKLVPAALRAGASGAAINAADALARGQDPKTAAIEGALGGGLGVAGGHAAGMMYDAAKGMFRPLAAEQRFLPGDLPGGVQVPGTQSQMAKAAGQPDIVAARAEDIKRKMGDPTAVGNDALAEQRLQQAHGNMSTYLGQDPMAQAAAAHGPMTGQAPPGMPQQPYKAGQAAVDDLVAQEQAKAQADVARMQGAQQQTLQLREDYSPTLAPGGAVPPPATAIGAGQTIGQRIRSLFTAARARTNQLYRSFSNAPAAYNPDAMGGVGDFITQGLNSGLPSERVTLNRNTSNANEAMDVINREVAKLRARGAAPPVAPAPAAPSGLAADVASIRAKYGDAAAEAYAKQQQAKPGAQSLLEFLASKGGLGPGDPELEAIHAHEHTVDVEGVGRRKLVKQGGMTADYAREAAEEAGYLPPGSTEEDLRQAIVKEMGGQKLYPMGEEGTIGRRAAAAASEREAFEQDRQMRGHEDALNEAGHGDLGPEVRSRAIQNMQYGMDADTAVDHAFAQLEQEDAARAAAGFPGDRAAPAAPGLQKGVPPITPADMEAIRQQLVPLRAAANAAGRAPGGTMHDARAVGRIMGHFDDWQRGLAQAPDGLLYGDPQALLAAQDAARSAHAQERQTFSKQRTGDVVGDFMERVVGKVAGQEMSPQKIVRSLLGKPGGEIPENAVPILNHLRDRVFGANSPEWAQLKQGLVDHLTATPPGGVAPTLEQQISRIQKFLANDQHAGAIMTPVERANLAAHANNLRAAIPAAPPVSGSVEARLAKLAQGGGQGFIDALTSKNGEQLVPALQQRLPQVVYNQLRQALWREVSEAPEGMIPWQHQKTGQKIAEFLQTPLAKAMFSPEEQAMMGNISRTHLNMVPVPGSVNTSGSAYTGAALLQGMGGHLAKMILRGIGLGLGHLPGLIAAEGAAHVAGQIGEKLAARKSAEEATRLFVGARPTHAPVTAPQRVGATVGRLVRGPSRQQQ